MLGIFHATGWGRACKASPGSLCGLGRLFRAIVALDLLPDAGPRGRIVELVAIAIRNPRFDFGEIPTQASRYPNGARPDSPRSTVAVERAIAHRKHRGKRGTVDHQRRDRKGFSHGATPLSCC